MDEESSSDLGTKYHILAQEYAKVRSHAAVLKKAVLDEQVKNQELKEIIKNHEQKIRKHDLEMDSVLFRNDQLSKRVSVLQEDLDSCYREEARHKPKENPYEESYKSLVNEELEKKIIENAELLSIMTDKDCELTDCRNHIDNLLRQVDECKKKIKEWKKKYSEADSEIKKQKLMYDQSIQNINNGDNSKENSENSEELEKCKYWQEECEKWKKECETFRSKPTSNEQLTEYYETKLKEMLEIKELCVSETRTLMAENNGLCQRYENLLLEYKEIKSQLENHQEELNTTTENYKAQLDAMTEHLAAQNDKITKLSDEVEILQHKLLSKK